HGSIRGLFDDGATCRPPNGPSAPRRTVDIPGRSFRWWPRYGPLPRLYDGPCQQTNFRRSPAREACQGPWNLLISGLLISRLPGSILPEVIGGVLQHHVHARFTVAVFQQVLYHRIVLAALLFVAGARLRDNARDVAYRGHELLFDCFLERFVAAVADLLAAARGRP